MGTGEKKMRIVSPVLKHVVYPGLGRAGFFRSSHGREQPAVITYHGILPDGYVPRDPALDGHLISQRNLIAQLRLLKSKYHLLDPGEFHGWLQGEFIPPPRSVLLTCDDGLRNVLSEMLPVLSDLKLHCLFFVTGLAALQEPGMLWHESLFLMLHACSGKRFRIAGRPGTVCPESSTGRRELWYSLVATLSRYEWQRRREILHDLRTQLGIAESWIDLYAQTRAYCERFFMMGREEIRQLAANGMVIGAHTASHPALSKMSGELAAGEIIESKRSLEQLLNAPVWALAFPFGNSAAVSAREPRLAREAGFTCAFMNIESGSGDAFVYPRVHVSAGMTLGEFEAHISGFDLALRRKYQSWTGATA
jgi:peptidoglycan/xylan/chitin deacetylase (PgdA/CDA1 family)